MSSKSRLRQLGIAFLIGAATNQILAPIAGVRDMFYSIAYQPPKICVSQDEISSRTGLPKSFCASDYLSVAAFLVNPKYDLNEKSGCVEYNRAIFDVYQALVEKNQRPDLADKIRICQDLKKKDGHLWIEYLSDNRVFIYDNSSNSAVGVRTFWGTKVPYPTAQNLLKPGGTLAVLLED